MNHANNVTAKGPRPPPPKHTAIRDRQRPDTRRLFLAHRINTRNERTSLRRPASRRGAARRYQPPIWGGGDGLLAAVYAAAVDGMKESETNFAGSPLTNGCNRRTEWG